MLKRHLFRSTKSLATLSWFALAMLAFVLWLFWLSTMAVSGAPLVQEEPTPDPCAPASVTPAGNVVNVRSGPSSNFDQVGQLVAGEERPVLARHWQFTWWQISMEDGSEGWVWDGAVEVSGNLDVVPVISEVVGDGQELEATWTPVMEGVCLATPVPESGRFISTPTAPGDESASGPDADDGWNDPVNLSSSGLASDPQVLVDSNGIVHVLWQEQGVDGFLYTQQIDGAWLRPAVVEVPFGTRRNIANLNANSPTPLFTPVLVADGEGSIHAFWQDNLGVLQYSSVLAADFATYAAWRTARPLTQAALGTVTVVDGGGGLHVSYVRTAETSDEPAGIYYLKSENRGDTWLDPVLLYASGYMRTAATTNNVQVDIAVAGQGETAEVYIVWDNPSQERVFLARSLTGGTSWLEPVTLDERKPSDHDNAPAPNSPTVSARDDELLIVWQAGHEDESCRQYFLYTANGNTEWERSGLVFEDFATCAADADLIQTQTELTLLLLQIGDQIHLGAWNGEQWSAPEQQETLTTFTNPVTFRSVRFGCLQYVLTADQQLTAIGCDPDRNDIWTTTRSLEEVATQFEVGVDWNAPVPIGHVEKCPNTMRLLADQAGFFHAFWLRERNGDETSILYGGWDGQSWIPSTLLFSPQVTTVEGISVVAAPNDQLMLFWLEEGGAVYFSRTNPGGEGLVFNAGQWSDPVQLSLPHDTVSLPDVAIDGAGNLFLAYAVPVNEGRGIYLMTSVDQGQTWDGPVTVYDAADPAWEVVGRPKLALSDRGTVSITWSRIRIGRKGSLISEALYSTQAPRDTAVFDEPNEVLLETEIPPWYDVASDRAGRLHQFWHEAAGQDSLLWHRQSEDDGLTWSVPTILFNGPGISTAVSAAKSDLHLLHATSEAGLMHWIWTEEGIGREADADISAIEPGCGGVAAISEEGRLVLLYGSPRSGPIEESDPNLYSLSVTERQTVPITTTSSSPVVVNALITHLSAAPTTPEATATLSPAVEEPAVVETPVTGTNLDNAEITDDGSSESPGLGQILLIGLLPVGLLFVVVVARLAIAGRR